MSILELEKDGQILQIEFKPPALLTEVLREHGFWVEHPCGGKGRCLKCAADISGLLSLPDENEQKLGRRLVCKTTLLGNARMVLPTVRKSVGIEGSERNDSECDYHSGDSLGVAVDIGTTTIAVELHDLTSGVCLAADGMRNPQTFIAADVIGRIEAAMNGKAELLQTLVKDALRQLTNDICNSIHAPLSLLKRMAITGNTTMLYLLNGKDTSSLSRYPFHADELFGCLKKYNDVEIYLPPCIDAFLGADLVCAILSSGMMKYDSPVLLCDIGTNGEICLWKQGILYTASTAAGPVFEGVGISCGSNSVAGAIDKAWISHGAIHYHTIDDISPTGICGSGVIDIMASLLEIEAVDETGYMEDAEYLLSDVIKFTQADVRMIQMGKSAISAGILTLLKESHTNPEDVQCLMIAGGFGSHLDSNSAYRIGLFPEQLKCECKILGNSALQGAAMLLNHQTSQSVTDGIIQRAKPVSLANNTYFQEQYIEQMFFPTQR